MENNKYLVSKNAKYWRIYFIVKIIYMYFALLVIDKIIPYEDSHRWMSGVLKFPEVYLVLTNSSHAMDFFGGISSFYLGTFFGHFPFLLLAFYGIYYAVNKINFSKNQLLFVLILLSLPSFSLFSVVAGKEAVGVFFMGITLGYIVDLINKKRFQLYFIEILAIYLMFVFKPQYLIAIGSIIFYILICNYFKLKSNAKLFIFIIYIFCSIFLLYLFSDIINELAFSMPIYFSTMAASTRENSIWIDYNDVFLNAPYGMLIGFIGPTLTEALTNPIQFIVFIESLFIISFLVYVILYIISNAIVTKKINFFFIALLSMSLFWLLFVHYPFGIMNPGSAIRYRENFYGFLVIFIYFIYLKYKKSINNLIS
jgi:hypothetical protein